MFKQNFNTSFNYKRDISGQIRNFIHSKHFVHRLIFIFIGGYIAYMLARLYAYMFALPLKLHDAERSFSFFLKYVGISDGFESAYIYPWTLLTHYIVHTSFIELLFNMIIIYLCGKLFLQFWGVFRFVLLLLLSLLAGVFAYTLAIDIIPQFIEGHQQHLYLGAGASAFALLGCMLVIVPHHIFQLHPLVKLKIKYVFVIALVVDLLLFFSTQPATFYAHLGGAGIGFVFGLVGKYIVDRFFFMRHQFKEKQFRKKENKSYRKPLTDDEYSIEKKKKQDKIDAILEKISYKGYDSLTKEEKDFLFHESKRM